MVAREGVLWIGGPSGVGKSTAARLLARRYGLRWYSADTRTWEHRDRALAAGDPDAARFEALTQPERDQLSFAQRRVLDLIPQRRRMVLEDLAALPAQPLVVAESTLLEPAMTDRGRAVWLTASATELLVRTGRRGWGFGRDADAEARRREQLDAVRDAAVPVLDCDRRNTAEVLAWVAQTLAGPLALGPVAADRAHRRRLIRAGNLAIVGQYRAGLARYGRSHALGEVVRAFDCECASTRCQSFVDLSITAAPSGWSDPPVLAHDVTAGE